MAGDTLGFNIWTKNMPQPYLELYTGAAHERNLPIVAVVDDVLPAITFDRTPEQSATYNNTYKTSMDEMGFDRVVFVSEMLPNRSDDLSSLYGISKRLGLLAFMSLLPEKKRSALDDLSLAEVIDTCWQLNVLEKGMSCLGISRYLTGKRSTAFFRQAKHTISNFEFDIIES